MSSGNQIFLKVLLVFISHLVRMKDIRSAGMTCKEDIVFVFWFLMESLQVFGIIIILFFCGDSELFVIEECIYRVSSVNVI